MGKCPECEYTNIYGVYFCEDCGLPLHTSPSRYSEVHHLDEGSAYSVTQGENGLCLWVHPQRFYEKRHEFPDGQVILGRHHVAHTSNDTIELSAADIERFGISRLHAALIPLKNGVGLRDLGSTNGTRLNGKQLRGDNIYKLMDADSIELGMLAMQIRLVN